MTEQYHGSIFWIEVEKIKPNPFQPRREFDEDRLRDLSDSVRQYGVLQPLVVTRKEIVREDGGITSEYELIAGERRLRASKLAGLSKVPAIIRTGEETDKLKLEMAIIENLQREDLNPVDRAQAFHQLVNEFGLKHIEVAKRVGKSREYVSNSVRILALPQEIIDALVKKEITEGHTRPLLMLMDRPAEQATLFREIIAKRMTVRDAENISRRIAYDKVRKKERFIDPNILDMEEKLSEQLGTRVKVEKQPNSDNGRITIDFFNKEDLSRILAGLAEGETGELDHEEASTITETELKTSGDDTDLYSVKNFSL
ncbi:MAG: ParB/RepB/Spo0J family partition protein [Candidatus Pacebacteria bacterium]|nr:ParB/RepB/Spo0J family partition protein [Candidatus Paceibacterota bacterium]